MGKETLSVFPTKPAPRLKPPVELQPKDQTASFRLRGTMREVYEQVSEVFGLNVAFDLEFDGDDEIRFDLDDANFRDTIYALIDVTGTLVIPIHSGLFLVAEDTQSNRNQLQPVATAIIPITEPLNAQDADELAKAVQQVLDIKRLFVDTARQQVLVRDTVRNVQLANALYRHLAYPRAEVVVDVDLITIADSSETTAGILLPTSFPVTNFSTILGAVAPGLEGTVPLLGIGGGKTVFGIAVASASLIAQQMKSMGQVFTGFSVRSVDGLPASFLVGERFPIINARFSAPLITDEISDSINDGSFREPFPSFTFEDLGLSFEMTPRIHSAKEVSLEIKIEVKELTGLAVNDIPILSNRTMETSVRLRDGELALISGLAILEKRRTRSGVELLSRIPWLGDLIQKQLRTYQQRSLGHRHPSSRGPLTRRRHGTHAHTARRPRTKTTPGDLVSKLFTGAEAEAFHLRRYTCMSFMIDEIEQQPAALERTLREELPKIEAFRRRIANRPISFVCLVARGTSDNAAVFGRF